MKHIYYMVSSIIMDGAEESRTIDDARKIAQREAKKLFRNKEYGNTPDGWVHIDKYNARTHINIYIESWKFNGKEFIRGKR